MLGRALRLCPAALTTVRVGAGEDPRGPCSARARWLWRRSVPRVPCRRSSELRRHLGAAKVWENWRTTSGKSPACGKIAKPLGSNARLTHSRLIRLASLLRRGFRSGILAAPRAGAAMDKSGPRCAKVFTVKNNIQGAAENADVETVVAGVGVEPATFRL